jgi:hypothetical protein
LFYKLLLNFCLPFRPCNYKCITFLEYAILYTQNVYIKVKNVNDLHSSRITMSLKYLINQITFSLFKIVTKYKRYIPSIIMTIMKWEINVLSSHKIYINKQYARFNKRRENFCHSQSLTLGFQEKRIIDATLSLIC